MEDNVYNIALAEMKEYLKNNKLIGNKLIKLYDDNTFLKFINRRAERVIYLNMSRSYLTPDEYYTVIISLSLIALKNYNGNFYDNVESYYTELYEKLPRQKINAKIRDILSKFKTSDKRYIEFPIKNAIVPFEYLDEYYEFMDDIYKLNFQRSLPENIDEEIKDVFEGISEKIRDDSDDLDIDVTNKTYKLIKSTQNIIKNQENIDEICELSRNVLRYIDYKEWNNGTFEEENSYYKIAYDKFAQKTGKDTLKKNTEKVYKEHSRWKPSFILENNNIFLNTPIHKIQKGYDPTKINIFVYNGEEPISLEEKPIIEQAIGYYIVKPKNIRIENPIGKITYQLLEGNNVIYDSKEELYRDYLLFNENGQEIRNNSLYEGICLIASDIIEDESIRVIKRNQFYNIGERYVKINDYFLLKNDLITFNEKILSGINGIKVDKIKSLKSENEINLYSKIKSILCNYDCDLDKLAIEINDKRTKIIECIYSINSINKTINIELSNLISGFYKIKIYDFTNDKIFYKTEFLLDEGILQESKKIEHNKYEIRIVSDFFGEIEKNIDIREGIEDVINFNEKFKYIITLDIPLYKIDKDGKWQEIDEYIWGDDINIYSKLNFNNLKFKSILIKDRYQNQLGNIEFSEYQSMLNLDLFNKYKEKSEVNIYLKDNYITLGMISILNECKLILNESDVMYDKNERELLVNTTYIGKRDLKIRLKDWNNNTVFEDICLNEKKNIIRDLKSKTKYTLEYIEEKSTSIFFKTEKILYSQDIYFFNYEDFIGRYYKIESIKYDDYYRNIIDRESYLINTFIIIQEHLNDEVYKGQIYQMRNNSPYYFKNINPVRIEFLSTDYSENVTTLITMEDEDGLLFDNVKKTVAEIESNNFPLINEYEVAIRKKERRF